MENEKKSSRLGVRLSAIIVAVLLVVCMTVPVFAASGTYPDDYPELPSDGYFVLIDNGQPTLYGGYPGDYISGSGSQWYFYSSSGQKYNYMYYYVITGGVWEQKYGAAPVFNFSDYNGTTLPSRFIWSSADVDFLPDRIVFVEPPPDPLAPIGSGLIVVLDWVGSVVSAVVSGPMSGLLILLAVPVAITLLLVAFVVIRRIIWGA